jgi:hypothetical protein
MGNLLQSIRGWLGSAALSERIRLLEEENEALRLENERLRREAGSPPYGQYDGLLQTALDAALQAGRPVSPILLVQALREGTPLGLKQAKEVVEDFCARYAPQLLPAWGYLEKEITVLSRKESDTTSPAAPPCPPAGSLVSRLPPRRRARGTRSGVLQDD